MGLLKITWRIVQFILISVICYDCYASQGIYKSKTYSVLKKAGIVSFCKEGYVQASILTNKIVLWCQKNFPQWIEKFNTVVMPYVNDFWSWFRETSIHLFHVSAPYRKVFLEKLSFIFLWFQESVLILMDLLAPYFKMVLEFLEHYGKIVWNNVSHIAFDLGGKMREIFK